MATNTMKKECLFTYDSVYVKEFKASFSILELSAFESIYSV